MRPSIYATLLDLEKLAQIVYRQVFMGVHAGCHRRFIVLFVFLYLKRTPVAFLKGDSSDSGESEGGESES